MDSHFFLEIRESASTSPSRNPQRIAISESLIVSHVPDKKNGAYS